MTNPMIKLILLSLLVISTGANDELMKNECSYTNVQTTCLNCLESDPTSHQADRVGLSRIVIHCLESHLQILSNNVTSLSSRIGEDQEFKKVLEDCDQGFSIANLTLHDADFHVVNGTYVKASEFVKFAVVFPLACRDNLDRFEFKESPQVYEQINLYAQLSDAAITMIQRLEYFI